MTHKRKRIEARYAYGKALGLIGLTVGAWSLCMGVYWGSLILFDLGVICTVNAGAWLVVRYAIHLVATSVEK